MADEAKNGHATEGMTGPNDFAEFIIGGQKFKVGPLTLWDLEKSKDDMRALDPTLPWSTYAHHIINIVTNKIGPEGAEVAMAESMMKKCSVAEARELAVPFNRLLEISGFGGADANPPEVGMEASGTGTSIESPPSSPPPSESQTSDTSSEPRP